MCINYIKQELKYRLLKDICKELGIARGTAHMALKEKNITYERYDRNFIRSGTNSVWRKRLIRNGKPSKCNRCGMKDNRILLVHHKNRNRLDNSGQNIEILCPNCHAVEHWVKHKEVENVFQKGGITNIQ